MLATEYDLAVDRAVDALADLVHGDQAAAGRLVDAVIVAAVWREFGGSQNGVSRSLFCLVFGEVLTSFGARLAADLAPYTESMDSEFAEVIDQVIADGIASIRADLDEIFT